MPHDPSRPPDPKRPAPPVGQATVMAPEPQDPEDVSETIISRVGAGETMSERHGAEVPSFDFGPAEQPGSVGASSDGYVAEFEFPEPPQSPDELGRMAGHIIRREIGRGAMGLVYEAEQEGLGRRVAMKVLAPHLAGQPTARLRFLREARAAAAVESDYVVPIYHIGEAAGTPFFTMRLLTGECLRDRLRRRPQSGEREILAVGRQVASGLSAAHACGLIHRDVKPANLWVEPDGRIRILDFGLARSTDPGEARLTAAGQIVGTPEYLAPEQIDGRDIDHRVDLFALGAIFHRMAAGVSPFRRGDLFETIMAVQTDTPPDLRELRPDLSPRLIDLIVRMLSKNPDDRPESAEAVGGILRDIQNGVSPTSTVQVRHNLVVPPGPTPAQPAANDAAAPAPQTGIFSGIRRLWGG